MRQNGNYWLAMFKEHGAISTAMNYKCKRCGKQFRLPQCRARHAIPQYCSFKCYRPPQPILTCFKCGKKFRPIGSRHKNNERNYCSLKCYQASKGGKLNPHFKGGWVTRQCKECCNAFSVSRAEANRPTKGKYCSEKCRHSSLQKVTTKEEANRILKIVRESTESLKDIGDKIGIHFRTFQKSIVKLLPSAWEDAMEKRRITLSEKYKRGRQFEYEVRRLLIDKGFIVMVSPGSKTSADLVALKRGVAWLIQCKLNGGISKDEKAGLLEMSERILATPIYACKRHGKITFSEVVKQRWAKRKIVSP